MSAAAERFAALTTAHVADGCLRVGAPVRCGPTGLRLVTPGAALAGRALPVRHAGSVDVFLEAFASASGGDVLVVDNAGRTDEACVGDLVVLEAQGAGLAGVVIWGLHRDSRDLRDIGLPVMSLGTLPTGPLRLDERPADALVAARVGIEVVTRDDIVFADDDGVLFVPVAAVDAVLTAAEAVRDTERAQAERMRAGTSLRAQVGFADYLTAREAEPALSFREHLRRLGGAVEV